MLLYPIEQIGRPSTWCLYQGLKHYAETSSIHELLSKYLASQGIHSRLGTILPRNQFSRFYNLGVLGFQNVKQWNNILSRFYFVYGGWCWGNCVEVASKVVVETAKQPPRLRTASCLVVTRRRGNFFCFHTCLFASFTSSRIDALLWKLMAN